MVFLFFFVGEGGKGVLLLGGGTGEEGGKIERRALELLVMSAGAHFTAHRS